MLKPLAALLLVFVPIFADPMDQVFARMDKTSATFRGMTAKLKQVAHTEVIQEDSASSGVIRIRRNKPNDLRMFVDFSEPDPKMVQLQGPTLEIYLPKIQTVQVYDLGKNSVLLEQFLLLGFGTTRKELSESNVVRYVDSEPVNGAAAVHIELTPKSKDILKHVQKIDLWLSPETGYPLQHKLRQPAGDYQLFVFSDLTINPDLPDSALKLRLPKNVKREVVQK